MIDAEDTAPIERRADRIDRIIREAAIDVFLAKGYDGATMEDIAVLAGVSKQTVYKHFADKPTLFAEIVLATAHDVDTLVRDITDTLGRSDDLTGELEELAERFLNALMQPRVLRLRRLVISSADRFPELGRSWYENGFERVLCTLTEAFAQLNQRGLLTVADSGAAANHFVGMLLWIPVNKAMFTGNDDYAEQHDLTADAHASAAAFIAAYRVHRG